MEFFRGVRVLVTKVRVLCTYVWFAQRYKKAKSRGTLEATLKKEIYSIRIITKKGTGIMIFGGVV